MTSPTASLLAGRTLLAAVQSVACQLAAAGVSTPEADARWLVAHVTGEDPQRSPHHLLTTSAAAALGTAAARRASREPLQLIVGHTGFRLLEIRCAPGVFIPRPETEVVAGAAIAAAIATGGSPLVVDLCTGTGAIACAVASEVPRARVVASDLHPAAVALARHNADRLVQGLAGVPGPAVGASVEVRQADLLDAMEELRGNIDVLVANPPYLPDADAASWPAEVADHDPHTALTAGPDGHEIVNRLLYLAATWLRPAGVAVVEIDDRRGPDALRAARAAGLVDPVLVTDLTGRDRAVTARRPATDG